MVSLSAERWLGSPAAHQSRLVRFGSRVADLTDAADVFSLPKEAVPTEGTASLDRFSKCFGAGFSTGFTQSHLLGETVKVVTPSKASLSTASNTGNTPISVLILPVPSCPAAGPLTENRSVTLLSERTRA